MNTPVQMSPEAIRRLPMPADYIVYLLRDTGCPSSIVKGTALDAPARGEQDRIITVADNLRCVANAAQVAASPGWYLEWGARMGVHLHGPLTPAMLSAPTLGDGLDLFCRYFGLRIPYMRLAPRRWGPWFEIQLRPQLPMGDLLALHVEIPLQILQCYITSVFGLPMPGAHVELAYPKPRRAWQIPQWLDCEITYDAPRNALSVPASWRATANLAFNPAIWEAAVRQCADSAAPLAHGSVADVRAELARTFAASAIPAAVPTLAELASSMSISPRTLIRRLRAAGTTYQEEIDAGRKQSALALLSCSGMPVASIAYALGFSDVASFNKAFKRWTGLTPRGYLAGSGHR